MAILAPEDMGRKLPPVGSPAPAPTCEVPQQFFSGLRASMPFSTLQRVGRERFIAADREAAIIAGCLTGGAAGGAGKNTPGGGVLPPVAIPKLPPPPIAKIPNLPPLPPLPPPPMPPGGGGGGGLPSPSAVVPAAGGAGIMLLIGLALLASFGRRK